MKPLRNDARPSELHAPEAAPTLRNRLPAGHRYPLGLEGALRAVLGDLSGPWDVSFYPVGRAWFYIDVVAPDASRWSLAVPVPEGPQAEDIAETVRAACARLRRIEPALAKPEGVGGGTSASGSRGNGTKAGRVHQEPTRPSSPNAPDGGPLLRSPETGELSAAQPAPPERA